MVTTNGLLRNNNWRRSGLTPGSSC
jgi:hypothetical protein